MVGTKCGPPKVNSKDEFSRLQNSLNVDKNYVYGFMIAP